jgi:single-strand DNA-binding protein
MASFNKVLLMGNLTRDPELRYIPSGTAVVKFGLAVNRDYLDKQSGEKKESVCFVDITVWGKQAETCNQYLTKGRPVFIEGRLEFSSWETKEGDKRSKLEVVAERVQFLGGRRDEGEGGGAPAPRREEKSAPRSAARTPVPASGGSGGPPPGSGGGDDLNLDDIPF